MSLGTLTVTQVKKSAHTNLFIDDVSVPGDGAYPTGGTAAFTTSLRAITKDQREVLSIVDQGANATYYPVYDKANDKLKIFVRATGVEVANAVDLSATTFKLCVMSF